MGRTRREYAETLGGSITGDGQEWDSSTAPNMTNGRTTINYSITIGTGKTAETFSQLTIWIDGVISLGPPTSAQIAFMSQYEGAQNLDRFPGYYISAGYSDESGATVSDGNYDTGYGVEIATGSIDFTVPDGDPGTAANATPITRITWGSVFGTQGVIDDDKQVLLSPTNFMIGNTNDDNGGAGWGIGLISVNGANESIPVTGNYAEDYFAKVRSDFNGDAHGDLMIQSPGGGVFIGEMGSNHAMTWADVATLGPQWTFVGTGDYLDEGHDQFLIENTAGTVFVADTQNGQAAYTEIAGLASGWKVAGTGDFLGEGRDQFLVESPTGVVYLNQVGASDTATSTNITNLGSAWKVIATGDFLGDGHDQFLVENAAGTVLAGDMQSGKVVYTGIATAAPGWTFDPSGAYLGTPGAGASPQTDLLVQSPTGELFIGEIGANHKGSYIDVGNLHSLKVVGAAGDYLGEGHDQFLVENAAGAVIICDYTGGALHFTEVGFLSAQWTLHG